MPVSSRSSRATPCSSVSPSSSVPPGMDHSPRKGSLPRRIKRARPRSMITPPIPTTGLSGYSLEEAIREVLADTAQCCSKQPHRARELTSYTAVYNTLHSGGGRPRTATCEQLYGGWRRDPLSRMFRRNRCGRRRCRRRRGRRRRGVRGTPLPGILQCLFRHLSVLGAVRCDLGSGSSFSARLLFLLRVSWQLPKRRTLPRRKRLLLFRRLLHQRANLRRKNTAMRMIS